MKTPGTTRRTSLAVRCGAAEMTSRLRTASDAPRAGPSPFTITVSGARPAGAEATCASGGSDAAGGATGALGATGGGDAGGTPLKRATARIFEAIGAPSRLAGSNVQRSAARRAAASSSASTLVSTSTEATVPSARTVRIKGTTTSYAEVRPSGHAVVEGLLASGRTMLCASADPEATVTQTPSVIPRARASRPACGARSRDSDPRWSDTITVSGETLNILPRRWCYAQFLVIFRTEKRE